MTTQMVRKQIYIFSRQEQLLKRLSKARGLSEAEIIRQAIDREAVSVAVPLPTVDEQSWQQTVAFMRSLGARATQFDQPYGWDRNDLYEERLSLLALRETGGTMPNDSNLDKNAV